MSCKLMELFAYINILICTLASIFFVNMFREEIMRFFSLVLLVLFLSIPVLAQPASKYVGVSHCLLCHSGESHGMVMEKWKAGPHARAYLSLETEKAKEILTQRYMLVGNPLDHSFCLECHAIMIDPKSTNTNYQHKTEGVSCEACHGQGKSYSTSEIMSNRKLAIKNGLIAEPKTTCKKCHNENGHSSDWYNYQSNWSKINHAINKDKTKEAQTKSESSLEGEHIPSSTEMMNNEKPEFPAEDPIQPKIRKSGGKKRKR